LILWADMRVSRPIFSNQRTMGQQSNKVIKRRRRKAYLERRKARVKAGVVLGKPGKDKPKGEGKPAAKKPSAKKAAKPAAKKASAAAPAPAPVTAVAPAPAPSPTPVPAPEPAPVAESAPETVASETVSPSESSAGAE
jgi:hypothetical protein